MAFCSHRDSLDLIIKLIENAGKSNKTNLINALKKITTNCNNVIDSSFHDLIKSFSSTYSKEILGKKICIYKVLGSKKEHVKYKGSFITLTEYRKLLKPIQSKIKR